MRDNTSFDRDFEKAFPVYAPFCMHLSIFKEILCPN